MSGQSYFNTEYIISVVLALGSSYGVAKASPALSPWITFGIIPLTVAYVSLQAMNIAVPRLNSSGSKLSAYIDNKTLGEINDMGYINVFPPLLAVAILVFVLLFTKNLG